MTPAEINDFATYLALAGVAPCFATFLLFTLGPPRTWYKSGLGWAIAALFASILAVYAIVLLRRFFGAYLGYEWVAIFGYAFTIISQTLVAAIIVVERRKGRALGTAEYAPRSPRKAIMSTEISTKTVPEIWFKAQRVIRTVLAVLVAIVTSVAGGLGTIAIVAPQVLAELQVVLKPEVFAWLVSVVGFIVVLAGVVTRVMAIPAVNALLTKVGAGSVPAGNVTDSGRVTPDTSVPLP